MNIHKQIELHTAIHNYNLESDNYTIKTTFNGTTVENTITILQTLI